MCGRHFTAPHRASRREGCVLAETLSASILGVEGLAGARRGRCRLRPARPHHRRAGRQPGAGGARAGPERACATAASRCRRDGSPSTSPRPTCRRTAPAYDLRDRGRDPRRVGPAAGLRPAGGDRPCSGSWRSTAQLRPLPGMLALVAASRRSGCRAADRRAARLTPRRPRSPASPFMRRARSRAVIGAPLGTTSAGCRPAAAEPRADARSATPGRTWPRCAGQSLARRALEIALAGRHHLFLEGVPGTGKTLLLAAARRPAASRSRRRSRSR